MGRSRAGNNFDGLRLIAAWLVLVSHSWDLLGPRFGLDPLARGVGIETLGGVAVIVFFAISGYLVIQSLERCPSMTDFVWRRMIRILPALWFFLLVAVLIIGPLFTLLQTLEYWQHSTTLRFLRGFLMRLRPSHLPGVFEDNPNPNTINGSLWTLPLEMRLYILLAIVGCLPQRFRARGIAIFLSGFVALTFAYVLLKMPAKVLPIFSELWIFVVKLSGAFCVGVAVAYYKLERGLRPLLGAVVVFLVCAVFRLIPAAQIWTQILFPLVVAWLALSIGVRAWPLLSSLGARGDFSYGVYLWAYPMQQIAICLFKPDSPYALIGIATALTLPMALLSWHWIEKPALTLKNRPFLRRRYCH